MSVESLLSTIELKLMANELSYPINEAQDLIAGNDIKLTESYLKFDQSIVNGDIINAIVAADMLSESSGIDGINYVNGFSDVLRSATLAGYNDKNHLIESLNHVGHAFYANNYLVKVQKLVPKTGMYVVMESTDGKVLASLVDDVNVRSQFTVAEAADNWVNFLTESEQGMEHTSHGSGRPDLRKARVEAGLSQQEMADNIGIGKSTLAKWELGFANPQHNMVEKAADAINLNPADFFDSGTVVAYEGNLSSSHEDGQEEQNAPPQNKPRQKPPQKPQHPQQQNEDVQHIINVLNEDSEVSIEEPSESA